MKTLKTCKTGCGKMKSGGPVRKVKTMAKGGQMYGIPQTGTTNYSAPTMKKGGATSNTKKFAALAPPYDKATFADKIAGAKKKVKLTKKQFGGTTSNNTVPSRTLENLGMFIGGGLGTALAARKQNQPMSQKKKERVLARQQKKAARKSR